ncbi:MAG TPA: ATP-dependent helicase, partial [Nocardioides sp.]|nr:ATP-dependent helicase [Nocardioides sp.]
MAQRSQRGGGGQRRNRSNAPKHRNEEGIIPVLARVVREVEQAVQRQSTVLSVRTKFQVIALLVREERIRIKADDTLSEGRRAEELKRLDGIATILAQTAARDSTLFTLLDPDAEISDDARALRRELLGKAGVVEPEPEETPAAAANVIAVIDRRVTPVSVAAAQLANPFQRPDFEGVRPPVRPRRLAGWELLEPLFRSFERAPEGATAIMELPEPTSLKAAYGRELMHHQAQLVA